MLLVAADGLCCPCAAAVVAVVHEHRFAGEELDIGCALANTNEEPNIEVDAE